MEPWGFGGLIFQSFNLDGICVPTSNIFSGRTIPFMNGILKIFDKLGEFNVLWIWLFEVRKFIDDKKGLNSLSSSLHFKAVGTVGKWESFGIYTMTSSSFF